MAHRSELGDLLSPLNYRSEVNTEGYESEVLWKLLETMLKIRLAEEAISELIISGEAKCPCHLGIGQEAVPVGLGMDFRKSDRIFGAHRSHSHFIAQGGSVDELIHEVLGKVSGASRGMGGSMHLFGQSFGFYGSVPIVAGTVPLAVGAALASKMQGGGDVAVAYFGDGASEEGVIHESLNLAAHYELPIVFVCENNLYSSHLDISQRQPSDMVSRFANAHHIQSVLIDGNDVLGLREQTGPLIDKCREGAPVFVEAITYRWRGHVGPDENIDVGVRRSAEDVAEWKQRDPIRRLKDGMISARFIDAARFSSLEEKVKMEISKTVADARLAPYPEEVQNMQSVFSKTIPMGQG